MTGWLWKRGTVTNHRPPLEKSFMPNTYDIILHRLKARAGWGLSRAMSSGLGNRSDTSVIVDSRIIRGLCSPFPNKQCFSSRKRNAAVRVTLRLTPQGSQRTQHLGLLCVDKCCQTVFLLCSHKFNSAHLKPPSMQLSFTDMLQIDHDTLENREEMRGGGWEREENKDLAAGRPNRSKLMGFI